LRYSRNKNYYMAKLYSKKKEATTKKLLPSKTTVDLILSYSKALKIVRSGNLTFESLSN